MRLMSSLALLGLAFAPAPLWAQAGSPGSDASPVVGHTGPVYVPDPQPRAASQGSKQPTPDNGNSGNASGNHSGRRRHRGGNSGGYAGVEGGPTS